MSYISCIVASCKTRRKPNTDKSFAIKCFSFPKDPVLKKEWLDLCQVNELDQAKDCNRKVCIKHFKEDDFVDGLKARLLNLQPTRLKKNAVPSLYLCQASEKSDNTKHIEVKKQKKMIEKCLDEENKKKTKTAKKNIGSSVEYLSKLVPIAPKALINQPGIDEGLLNRPTERHQYSKLLEHTNIVQPKVKESISDHRLKILQHDNAIYKKRISILLDSQNKLISRIKDLEEKIKIEKEDFIGKVKEAFAHVLTPNQVDILLGKKTKVWWTDVEFDKAYDLQHFGKQAYCYVRDTLNFPLPGYTTLQQWVAKMGAEVTNPDDAAIKPPLPKRMRLKFDKINTIYYHNDKENDVTHITEGNHLSTDINTKTNGQLVHIFDSKPMSETDSEIGETPKLENDSLDEELDTYEENDDEYNITIDKSNENEALYEQIDYVDDNNITNNVCNSDPDIINSLNCYDDENDEESDEYYEELIIENLSDHESDYLSQGRSIEEDNG